jgi:hypothetical protein
MRDADGSSDDELGALWRWVGISDIGGFRLISSVGNTVELDVDDAMIHGIANVARMQEGWNLGQAVRR